MDELYVKRKEKLARKIYEDGAINYPILCSWAKLPEQEKDTFRHIAADILSYNQMVRKKSNI